MENKLKDNKMTWTILGAILFLYIISIIVIRINNPDFIGAKFFLSLVLGIIVASGIVVYILYFSSDSTTNKQSGQLPPPITFLQARHLAQLSLADPMYMDELDLDNVEYETVEAIGKPACKIYVILAKGKHAKNKSYCICINMHYPDILFGVLVNPSDVRIRHLKLKVTEYPEAEPNKKVTVATNPLLGTQVYTEESEGTKEKKDEEKKDDLDKK